MRMLLAASLMLGVLSLFDSTTANAQSVPETRLPGHVLQALARATPLPRARYEAGSPLTLTVVLKRDDQSGFDEYLQSVYTPGSPDFRQFLTPTQMADRFGPTRQEYAEVLTYLRAQGFELVSASANRLTMTVSGSRANAERAFDLRIGEYRVGQERFYANDRDPRVPARVGLSIQAIIGLTDLSRPRPSLKAFGQLVANLCKIGVGGANAEKANIDACKSFGKWLGGYATSDSIDPPGWEELDGTGQTVALLEFDSFQRSDIADYLNFLGAPASQLNNVSEISVAGGASLGSNQDEVLLDIDTILVGAPGAKVAVYDAPFTGAGSFQALLNAAINGGATIISNSWAYCEDQTTSADAQSIDSILQSAAAGGIAVFNGAGDTGTTCLDGSANTVAVPADAPHGTAVGGSSMTLGPGFTYGSETWWNGAASTPPTGQGGFGVSAFFSRPAYQAALSAAAGRSVPDVVANADPAQGVPLCLDGQCPNGLLYGGTSVATPAWAAMTALLNQALGHNVGAFNQAIYPFANTSAFHNATSMGSDFAHVGLGSPSLNQLYMKLAGITNVGVSASLSQVTPYIEIPYPSSNGLYADGQTPGYVNVRLLDNNGNPLPGKTVSLRTVGANSAIVTPINAVTTSSNGIAIFKITDLVAETVAVTATDSTDGIPISQSTTLPFTVPPAASAGLNAFPTTVTADGVSTTTISVTLEDALGRPTPGKVVTVSQGSGHSTISGPNPPVTNASGQIQFTASDQVAETVTYSAVDVTDGNLPFPSTGTVTFTGGPANGCGNANPVAAPGFLVQAYATGFVAQNFFYGSVNYSGCPGAWGVAFDASGDLYVSDAPTGNIYKFPPGGGVANSSTLLTKTPIGPSIGALVFDTAGHLYTSQNSTTGNFTTGAVFQIDPSSGAVLRTVASNLTCPESLALDPLSGDLFTDDTCTGDGSDNPSVFRIHNPASASPAVSVYTTLPGTPNATLTFAPTGTLYAWALVGDAVEIAQISGTNGPVPPTLSFLPSTFDSGYLGLQALGSQANGSAAQLILNTAAVGNNPVTLAIGDLTSSPPSIATTLLSSGVVNDNLLTVGPDGCVYLAAGDAVFRVTDTTGACNYTKATPTLALAPASVSPNPAQGTSETFTATLHYASVPAGSPVTFQIIGANPGVNVVNTNASGSASFTYTAAYSGTDTVSASMTVNGATITSPTTQVTWTSGQHTTFLTLNPSPTSGTTGVPVTLIASLTDVSVHPAAALSGRTVTFDLGNASCIGQTNANGLASCSLTPNAPAGTLTLIASFEGDAEDLPSTDSESFTMSGPPPTQPTNLAGNITAETGPTNARVWTLTVYSSGPGAATGAKITAFNLTQSFGAACKPVVQTPIPVSVGNVPAAGSLGAPITINFTGCPANARFTVRASFSANGGAATGSLLRYNQFE
jgi:Pro-kumamolisin, activation domain/Bacterial Ig-like domain (group 1)